MTNTIAAKIAKASADVGGKLKADKTNMQDKYDYISANKILSECGQALAAQGVTVIPSMTDAEVNIGTTAGGKNRYDARVTFAMTVTDGDSEMVFPWYGFGADYTTPDKAVYKAITSGHKYFVSKLLMIGEGNEDGEHESAPDNGNHTPQQAQNGKPKQEPAQPAQNGHSETNGNGPSKKQLDMMFAIGVKLYGKDVWNNGKRAQLVSHFTKKRTDSAAEMTPQECSAMLDALKEKEQAQEVEAVPA